MYNYIMQYFWITIQIIVGYNLILPITLYLFYTFKSRPSFNKNLNTYFQPDYGIIVTAYEQTDSLPSVVNSLLNLNYKRYLIYIVADKCDISTLNFNDERVIILLPEETLGSNTKSHFYAIKRFKRDHDHITIIDSDNLVDPNYLNEINKWFEQGYEAIQGVREAKILILRMLV